MDSHTAAAPPTDISLASLGRLSGLRWLSVMSWGAVVLATVGPLSAALWATASLLYLWVRRRWEARLAARDGASGDWRLVGIGFGASLVGAVACVLVHAQGPQTLAAALLLTTAGIVLGGGQYRISPARAALMSAPYSVLLAAIVLIEANRQGEWALAIAILPMMIAYWTIVTLARTVHDHLVAAKSARDRLIGELEHARDDALTAQRRAEMVATRLELALEGAQSAVWEIDFDAQRAYGLDEAAAILGRPIAASDLFPEPRVRCGHAEDDAALNQLLTGAASAGRGQLLHRALRPDGAVSWIESRWRRIPAGGARSGRLIVLSSDVSERQERLQVMLSLVESATEALSRRTELMSELAAHLGLPALGQMEQDHALEAEGPQVGDEPRLMARLRALLTRLHRRETQIRQAVEALREAQTAADDANRAKSQFLANMSHELRTPLNAIIGYGEILHEEALDRGDGATSADMARILAAARRLLTLINEVLDLSKIEAGRMDIETTTFDVADLACEAIATCTPAAEANGNRVTVAMSHDIGAAHTDGFKLSQCLLNLLSNATKFTKDGVIGLWGWRERNEGRDWLVFEVSDTGIGIPQNKLEGLFQPFVQADSSTTRHFGGTGLGLTITRRIMHLLGGEVYVDSTPGRGSTFTLRLPANFHHEQDACAAAAPEDVDPQRPVIVVIDDDASARDLARRALGRFGFSVRTAATASAGLEAIAASEPALVLLDVNLPDQPGWTVLDTLRERGDAVPVLVVSVDDDRPSALAHGACERLVKPVDRDRLAAAVLRFARRRPEVFYAAPAPSTRRLSVVNGGK